MSTPIDGVAAPTTLIFTPCSSARNCSSDSRRSRSVGGQVEGGGLGPLLDRSLDLQKRRDPFVDRRHLRSFFQAGDVVPVMCAGAYEALPVRSTLPMCFGAPDDC